MSMKKQIPIFKFHIPKKELIQYFNPVCSVCKRSRNEINKRTNLKGVKVLAEISVFVFDSKPKPIPICNDCLLKHKKIPTRTMF